MTSDAQRAANRRNASQSTGPRTADSKATTSQNARQHGATAAPPPARVACWFRVIVNRPEAKPSELLTFDPEAALAISLAEAEARLCAAIAALEVHLNDPMAAGRSMGLEGLFKGLAGILINDGQNGGARGEGFQNLIEEMRRRIRHAGQVRSGAAQRERLLRRYARETQRHRDRCFASWIAHLSEAREPAPAYSSLTKASTRPATEIATERRLPKQTQIQL